MMWTNRIAKELSAALPVAMADFPSAFPPSHPDWPAVSPSALPVGKGDRVRIHKGVFRGVEGTIVARRGVDRLIIAVELLQPGVTIEVDARTVQSLGTEQRTWFRR